MKKELQFWSYYILTVVIGAVVGMKAMMLTVDVLIKYDVAVWAATVIYGLVFISVFALAAGFTAFAITKFTTVLMDGIKFKIWKNQ